MSVSKSYMWKYICRLDDRPGSGRRLRGGIMNGLLSFLFMFFSQSVPSTMGETNTFSLVQNAAYKDIRPANFIANASFSYRATYEGVTSNQTEFAEALRDSGVRGLRFPGGTMAHFYMWEGKEVTDALKIDIDPIKKLVYKLYSPTNYSNSSEPKVQHWPKSYYTPLTNFLNFCHQEQFFPLLQVNTSFYYDSVDEKTRAICRSSFIYESEANNIVPDYWDYDRIQEATNRLAENIQTYIIDPGYGPMCRYWEIGNEDFMNKDWETNGPSDDAAVFAEILAGYTEVIKSKIPDAEIYFPSEQWEDEVLGWLVTNAPSSLAKITGEGRHYPFAAWPLPTDSDMASDPEAFAVTDVKFDQNIATTRNRLDSSGFTNLTIATTETTMWKLNGTYPWNSKGLNGTVARALMTAHNFGELVFRPLQDSRLTVHFDLSSPFFGILPHDVWIEDVTNSNELPVMHARRAGSDLADLHDYDFWSKLDAPSSNVSASRRIDGYHMTPAAWVMSCFSAMSGKQLVDVQQITGTEYVSAFSSCGGNSSGELDVIIVNRTPNPQYVRLKNQDQFSIATQQAEATVIEARNPQTDEVFLSGAMCDGSSTDDYLLYTTNKYVRGSGYADKIFFQGWVKPWSVSFYPISTSGSDFYNENFMSYDYDTVFTNGTLFAAGNMQWNSEDSWASTGMLSVVSENLSLQLHPSSTGYCVYGFAEEVSDLSVPPSGVSCERIVELSFQTLAGNSTGAQALGVGFYADGSLPAAGSWGATIGLAVQVADFNGTPKLMIRRRGTDGNVDSWDGDDAWTNNFTFALSDIALNENYTIRSVITDGGECTLQVFDENNSLLESATSPLSDVFSYADGLRWIIGDYNSQNANLPYEFTIQKVKKETY